jgi:hypothetical protein
MSAGRHTPGPWKSVPIAAGVPRRIIAPTDSEKCGPLEICTLADVSRVDDANAALIAAAPALLAALELVASMHAMPNRTYRDNVGALAAVRAAIALARAE